jgi:hypothetical protein
LTEFSASPHVYTGRWGSYREWPPGVVPIRISIGLPRFLPRITKSSAHISDLMPWGLFKITDRAEFTERFRRRLDAKGPELIQQQFDYLHEAYAGRILMLCCYEDLRKPGEWCHRLTFAEWWHDRTGEVILDLQLAELGETDDHVRQSPPGPTSKHEHRAPAPEPEPPPPALF